MAVDKQLCKLIKLNTKLFVKGASTVNFGRGLLFQLANKQLKGMVIKPRVHSIHLMD